MIHLHIESKQKMVSNTERIVITGPGKWRGLEEYMLIKRH